MYSTGITRLHIDNIYTAQRVTSTFGASKAKKGTDLTRGAADNIGELKLKLMEFKDYPQERIQAVLDKVQELEQGNLKDNPKVLAWKRWATDPEYRYREWLFRQYVAQRM